MLLPYVARGVVRAVDLGVDLRPRPSAWLAMFEQARWDAWFAAGVRFEDQIRGDMHFVVRAQHLSLGPAVTPGEDLRIEISLESVGNTSLTMGHRAWRVSDGAEVARDVLVAVTCDATGRPIRVPADLRDLASHGGLAMPEAPPWGPPPAECWAATLRTRRSDLDLLQHVNQSRYGDLVLDAFSLAAEPIPALSALRLEYDHEIREHLPVELIGWSSGCGVHRVVGRVGEQVCLRATLWDTPSSTPFDAAES